MNRSQIKSFKIIIFLRGQGKRTYGRAKIRYFLKRSNCGCIINNPLKFDI